jgi:hypothetical protein
MAFLKEQKLMDWLGQLAREPFIDHQGKTEEEGQHLRAATCSPG